MRRLAPLHYALLKMDTDVGCRPDAFAPPRTCNEIWERQITALSATAEDVLDYGRYELKLRIMDILLSCVGMSK